MAAAAAVGRCAAAAAAVAAAVVVVGGAGVVLWYCTFENACPQFWSACVRICPHLSAKNADIRILSASCLHCVRMCPHLVRDFFHDIEL